jgi:hypothetical protein
MTPDVCAEMGADGIERPDTCPANEVQCFVREFHEDPRAVRIAHNNALIAAGTCAVPSVRWSGWAIFTEDGDFDYYAYATDEEAALAIARDAGCEGGIYAIEDGDGVGTCQEVA